jgi:ATP-dependent Clp protease adapter protein ClpS
MVNGSLKLNTKSKGIKKKNRRCVLYMHNDSVNSFEHVIKTLSGTLPMCNTLRATQLAHLVHENGSCAVYHGRQVESMMIYGMLSKAGLKITLQVN